MSLNNCLVDYIFVLLVLHTLHVLLTLKISRCLIVNNCQTIRSILRRHKAQIIIRSNKSRKKNDILLMCTHTKDHICAF